MKKALLILLMSFSFGCSAMPVKDPLESPASLNQRRLIINDEVGFVSAYKTINVRGITSGTFSIRGKGDCGYYDGISYDDPDITYSLLHLPKKDNCIYDLELRDSSLDAPLIGQLFVRYFDDPDVRPLNLISNGIPRDGVNWVQLNEDTNEKSMRGILEDRVVTLKPKGTKGIVYISGCGARLNYEFEKSFSFNIKSIYPVDKDCTLDILVNSVDYLKEGASLFVAVYKKSGGFLATPIAYKGRYSRMCFSFKDPYVGYVVVNGRTTSDNSGCGFPANSYVVEGITSKGRIFYGKWANGDWEWTR